MTITRRQLLSTCGLLLLNGSSVLRLARAAKVVDIAMGGTHGGAHVWFRPAGLLVQPGQTLRWINQDAGNAHTATCYDTSLYGKPRRIPQDAQPWDSGFLLPGETFSVTLTVPGVYDYYCLPHERAGMVGRIIVGGPEPNGWQATAGGAPGLPESALRNFPSIDVIMTQKTVFL